MNQLEKTKELVLRLECKLSRLRKYGFSRIKVKESSCGSIYVNKSKGVVVKRPYLTFVGKQKVPSDAVETIVIESEYAPWPDLDRVFIQPLVDVSIDARIDSYIHFRDKKKNHTDLKSANCGMYKGKPVLIDW